MLLSKKKMKGNFIIYKSCLTTSLNMDNSLFVAAPLLMLRLMRENSLKRDEIIKLQNKKLRRLVKHSFENVPYYHKLFKASGIRPKDIRTADDLDKIPISKKTDVSNLELREIVASNINLRKCSIHRTSGTSGVKLELYRTNKFNLTNLLHMYLGHLKAGVKLHSKHFLIGGVWIQKNL